MQSLPPRDSIWYTVVYEQGHKGGASAMQAEQILKETLVAQAQEMEALFDAQQIMEEEMIDRIAQTCTSACSNLNQQRNGSLKSKVSTGVLYPPPCLAPAAHLARCPYGLANPGPLHQGNMLRVFAMRVHIHQPYCTRCRL